VSDSVDKIDGIEIKYVQKQRRTNKELTQVADEMGIDPFIILLQAASGDYKAFGYESATITKMGKDGQTYEEDVIPVGLRVAAAKEATQYLYPKKRAIEVSGDPLGGPVRLQYEGSIVELIRTARGKV